MFQNFDGGWFGMHMFWWFFWILMLVSFFSFLTPVPRKKARLNRLTPFDILQRRYAAGEISTEDYEERKARLERDAPPIPRPEIQVSRKYKCGSKELSVMKETTVQIDG